MTEFQPKPIGVRCFVRPDPDSYIGFLSRLPFKVRDVISKLSEHKAGSIGCSEPKSVESWDYLSEQETQKLLQENDIPGGYIAIDGNRYIRRAEVVHEKEPGVIY